jgi:hypothetical protein
MKTFKRKDLGIIEFCIEIDDEIEEGEKQTLYIDFVEAKSIGCGKPLMNKFIAHVTKKYNLKSITLCASEHFGTPMSKLVSFYSILGFREMGRDSFGVYFQYDVV